MQYFFQESYIMRVYLASGNLHEVLVELEGMGGGGKVHLEVWFKS